MAPLAHPEGRWAMPVALALAGTLLLALPPLVPAPPARATDTFVSNCTQMADPPPNGFQKWSDLSTWTALGMTAIPGVGAAAGVNVTIPCGSAILLDVPAINLTVLQVQGFLKVWDPPTPTTYSVTACLVLVEGQLSVGSSAQQFRSKITFLLVPNPNNRNNWTETYLLPAEPAFPRNIGHKAFVVVGGQVRLHGMPGGASTPSWVKLNVTARVGDFQIVVDTDVSQLWPVGSQIAVASTDFNPERAEQFTINGYDTHPQGTIIHLDSRVSWMHWGDPFGIPDGFGGFIDERAEVALLSRNILITGLDEPGPFLLEGGHFMIFMTAVAQFIEGVEFWLMGQQGLLGRYNIHFHVCADTQGRSVVRKNSIHDSKQRCVVLHATHNVTVDSNVAFNTSGHCYIIEEGGELNNTFVNNLGIWQRSVSVKIPGTPEESDDRPATFWITNMLNNYINNVAAGSEESGFWTELKSNVRGMSLSIPALSGIVPRNTPFGTITGNVAHSNRGPGWRFYPSGVDPKAIWDSNQTTRPQWQWPSITGTVRNLLVYKQQNDGLFMHNSQGVQLINLTSADNNWGVELNINTNAAVIGSRFLALSNNVGNPNVGWCASTDVNRDMMCAPASVTGCSSNNSDSKTWRQRNWNHWKNPLFGISTDAKTTFSDPSFTYTFSNNRFAGFEPICGRVAAAIGVGLQGGKSWWSSNQSVSGLRLSTPTANPVWYAPVSWSWPVTSGTTASPISYFESQMGYTFWDRDGSIVGGTGGYLVANNPDILPPTSQTTCTFLPNSNAYACPNSCYRTLQITYYEDGFSTPRNGGMNRSRGDWSYLIVRRVEDNATRMYDGNANDTTDSGTWRSFWVNLYAPATYELSIGLPFKNPSFWPANLTMQYEDAGACGAPITLRIMSVYANQWALATNSWQFWSPCAGASFTGNSSVWPLQYQYVCHRNRQVLQLQLLGNLDPNALIFLVNNRTRVLPCRLASRCGVWTTNDWYAYNTSGLELRSPRPGAMGYPVPGYDQSSWLYGRAGIGNFGWTSDLLRTTIRNFAPRDGFATYYFRKSFTVANSACYSGLLLEYVPFQGLLVFLNNNEVFRFNLLPGNVTNATLSNTSNSWPTGDGWFVPTFINLTAVNASLVEGTNWMAFEIHSQVTWDNSPFFDTRLSLQATSVACTGASIMPEVCDGLDNNFDGLVDVDPATGKLLSRPCATACGTGIETCISGAFQNCTAPPSLPETCNGKDDNCDGLVDNGLANAQMDCGNGSVCFQGQCLQQTPLTVPQTVFSRSTGGWLYLDKGWPWQTYKNWNVGQFSSNVSDTTIRGGFKAGAAPFATSNYSGPWNTTLTPNNLNDIYYFYLRNFTLSATEAANTWSLSVNVKRDQGVVVWSNGVEIMRNNFPASWNPPQDQYTYPSQAGTCWNTCYWPNAPTRSTGVSQNTVKAGTNWVAAQVANTQWVSNTNFDLELVRNVNVSCSSLPGAPSNCVRNPLIDTTFFTSGSVWKYLDANYSLPPFTWTLPSFDDSAWPSGPALLGAGYYYKTLLSMNKTTRQAYYFRKNFTAPDASCFYSLFFQLRALDGVVVYVNGIEAFRSSMQLPWVLPTSLATGSGPERVNFTLPGGWLVPGNNLIAAELHPSAGWNTNWFFDLALSGQREGVNCLPLPP